MSSTVATPERTYSYTLGNVQDYFADWLLIQMKARDLSQAELSRRMKISASAVNRWLKGYGTPDTESCAKLAEALKLPLDDVYRAAGHPSGEAPSARNILSFEDKIRGTMAELLAAKPVEIRIQDQTASAGPGDDILDDFGYLSQPRAAGRNISAIRVHGNSMQPVLDDGDVVFVDHDRQAHPGEMVVASKDQAMVIKWLRQEGQRQFLEGNNGLVDATRWKIDGVVIKIEKDAPRSSASPQGKPTR